MISSGRPIAQVAPENGVVEGTLGNWVRLWKEEHPEAGAAESGPVEWARYKALQLGFYRSLQHSAEPVKSFV